MKRFYIILLSGFLSLNLSAQHNYDNQSVIYSNNGNVGVGTSNPTNLQGWQRVLNVDGNGNSKIISSSNSNFRVGIYSHSTWGGTGAGIIGTESNHTLHFITGYNTKMSILTNGNVGIGTSNPTNLQGWQRVLNVDGNGNSKIVSSTNSNFRVGLYSHSSWNGGGGFIGTESNHNLHFITNYDAKMSILTNGNVGIGTTNPTNLQGWQRVLNVDGNGNSKIVSSSNSNFRVGIYSHSTWGGTGAGIIGTESNHTLHFITNYDAKMSILTNGNVGIGTTAPDAKLAVRGDIHTQEVRVDLNGAVAPDFVFEPDYKLRTLTETETYIKANKHLPEIPSATEMEQNGIELKTMNLKLLQKVEELTLYTIEQDKTLKLQQQLIELQQEQLQSLQKQINELKQPKNK